LYNPAVTDDDRTAMGLPIYKGGRSPVQPPAASPQLLSGISTRRIIKVYYKDEGQHGGGQTFELRQNVKLAASCSTPEAV
jgi:hypothetical protein